MATTEQLLEHARTQYRLLKTESDQLRPRIRMAIELAQAVKRSKTASKAMKDQAAAFLDDSLIKPRIPS